MSNGHCNIGKRGLSRSLFLLAVQHLNLLMLPTYIKNANSRLIYATLKIQVEMKLDIDFQKT